VYVDRRGDQVTVIVPPVGWSRRLFLLLFMGATLFCLPAAYFAATLLTWVSSDLVIAYMWAMIACPMGVYLLAYSYHLAKRRVRIDAGGVSLRRTILSPFGRWERAWDARRLLGIVRSDDPDGPGDPDATQALYMLYAKTRDGNVSPLLDSPDPREIDRVAGALREALHL
jgi:hypothetical protein